MKEYAVAGKYVEGGSEPLRNLDQYYSVEISIVGLGVVYQFKIWQTTSVSLFILVKESSCLLPFLKIGDRLNMKFYSIDMTCPYQSLDTKIRDIVRHRRCRLKSHYLVELEIMENNGQEEFHLPFRSIEGQILPFNASFRKSGGD
ncbi:hypothetical protein ACFL0H_05420 [Thermodesulfobacteriota bacterium]